MRRHHQNVVLIAALVAAGLPAASAEAAPTCFGRTATLVGTDGNDRLVGTPGPDETTVDGPVRRNLSLPVDLRLREEAGLG